MATQAYRTWDARGRPFTLCRPIAELKAMARLAGVPWLGDLGNEAHLQASTPEDHTPYSVTAWPLPLPGYVVTAGDLANGPWMPRLLAAAKDGRAPWVKYLNYGGHNYSVKRGWAPVANPDEHGHVSVRTDQLDAKVQYNPFTDVSTEEKTMPTTTDWRMHTLYYDLPTNPGGEVAGEANKLRERLVGMGATLDRVASGVAAIEARPPAAVMLTADDRAALIAALRAELGPIVAEQLRALRLVADTATGA